MIRKLPFRRAALALVLPLLSALPEGAAAYDHDILHTQVPGWSIVAHKYSGKFGGCSAWTEQPGGFQLHLINSGTEWRLATTFNPADHISGRIDVDGQRWTTAFFSDGEMLVSPLNGPIIDAAAAGHLMRLTVGGNVLSFSMTGSRGAIHAVFDCLRQPW
jgi:hypothetical protein